MRSSETSFNPDLCPEQLSHWHNSTGEESLPAHLLSWLDDRASLTARLQQHCQLFRVEVLRQGPNKAIPAELALLKELGIEDESCLVREVLLLCDSQPWVFARTLMPESALTGKFERFRDLDDQPLGPMLFSDPDIHRGPMHRLRVESDQLDCPLWGRRSAFLLAGKPVLVSEVFLPGSAAYPDNNHQKVSLWRGSQDDCYAG